MPFNLQDYLDLVDWTGRCIRDDKRGAVDPRTPKLLAVLCLAEGEWLPHVTAMQARYEVVMGAPEKMKALAQSRGGDLSQLPSRVASLSAFSGLTIC